ncbi:MAG: VOC family protein [Parasphingorhabdus sp.]|uniref:VOC family protein n=1 Tax=Parasphingorhabdus sp. TaxID=2709688 RepID=UPI003296F5D7
MKRFHVNLKVSDMEKSQAYYARLFGVPPTMAKPDYIKWMLDDPFINFSIEPTDGDTGIAHVGLQAENPQELNGVYENIRAAAGPLLEEGDTTCCYAASQKNWTQDPDGLIWEAFYTEGQVTHYGQIPDVAAISNGQQAADVASEAQADRSMRCC